MATTSDSRVNPPISLEQAIEESKLVVGGRVASVSSGIATIEITDAFWGEKPLDTTSIQVAVASRPSIKVGVEGVWILDGQQPANILNANGPLESIRAVERVFAGLPAVEPEPPSRELRAMYAKADVVSFGSIERIDASSGTFREFKTVKGSLAGPILVERGPLPEQPGGPWEFDDSANGPFKVTLYLVEQDGRWIILNPSDPTLYWLSSLEKALEKRFE